MAWSLPSAQHNKCPFSLCNAKVNTWASEFLTLSAPPQSPSGDTTASSLFTPAFSYNVQHVARVLAALNTLLLCCTTKVYRLAHTCQKHHNHKTSDKSPRDISMLSFFFFLLKLMGYFFPKLSISVNYYHRQSFSTFYFHKFSLYFFISSPLLSLQQAFNSWFCAMLKIISCKIRFNFRLFEHYWQTSI